MAKNATSLLTSLVSPQSSTTPTKLPEDQIPDIQKYRKSKDGQALVSWVQAEFTKAKQERSGKQLQWYSNMAFFYGQQWLERTSRLTPGGYDQKLFSPRRPRYREKKTINRTRSFVRTELAKFVAQMPSAQVVPATAEDEDMRAAYAAEQAWESISNSHKLARHFKRAQWWTVVTGNGFIKTWWDESCLDPVSGQMGDIRYGSVTPFHLLVPDLRETEIEDQPFVINAYTKPVQWCKQFFAEELKGVDISPSVSSANQILEGGKLNLSASSSQADSCILYEAWLKPGAHKLFPNGAVVLTIDDILVSITPDGLPYDHQEYPFTKFEHIPTATFYADSPLVDTNNLQREFNQIRSEISEAGRRMAKPQLVAQKGSIVPSKVTNEPGMIIEYRPGTQAPTPLSLTPLPQYYVEQQDRILADWEDITGQHDASKGNAPPGVTAGTAINFLQEKDDSFLAPEYESVEEGWERIASQTIQLFVQYVDVPRKIKTVGADGSFDTLLLSGEELRTGTDIRMEKGSSVAQSQAGRQAQVSNLFQIGLIDQPTALKLLEIGGVQKALDVVNVAERKAQRENIKMKMLTDEMIQEHDMAFLMAAMQKMIEAEDQQAQLPSEMGMPAAPGAPQDPGMPPNAPPVGDPSQPGGMPGDPSQQGGLPGMLGGSSEPAGDSYSDDPSALEYTELAGGPGQPPKPGPVIPVDDFDVHAVHIDTHNKFRMSQEFEALPGSVKAQFSLHVKLHEQAMMRKTLQSFFSQIPSDGTDGGGSGSMDVPVGGQPGQPAQGPGASMSANGAVPDTAPQPGGQNG